MTALIELKARLDEERNILWARELEKAGVHVVFGFVGLKTHCKVALVVRREDDGIRRYVHLGDRQLQPADRRHLHRPVASSPATPDFGEDAIGAVQLPDRLLASCRSGRKLVVAPLDLQTRHDRDDRPGDGPARRRASRRGSSPR